MTPLYVLREGETILFAARELEAYLEMIDDVQVNIEPAVSHAPGDCPGLYLGLLDDFGIAAHPGSDSTLDDRIYIDVMAGRGIIAGANPRSILIAVYRFLEQAGCRWIRPGKNGESIPRRSLGTIAVQIDETPSYRYRGMCIEGAVSLENMLDSIDWAPKAGKNSYFIEFMVPYTFFDRWYRHLNNPYKEPEALTVEQVIDFRRQMEREIEKRGLLYHAAGHGWTCEPLGIPGLGWDPAEYTFSDEVRSVLAEVNGRREIWQGIPLNTNLCYSNARARKTVVDYAVKYAQHHPAISLLHVWLADASNNHCECANCRDTLPADLYIQLLNEMDAALTEHGVKTRIAFIAYLDLLWPPQHERFNNPDRFALLFAPISRTYSKSYDVDTSQVALKPYRRNKLHFPADITENLAYLRAWQKLFSGDSFTYEYHFMWDHYFDPAYYETAKILNEDVKRLKQVGLQGLISDQTQRAYFPTGFGMYVLAKTLWDDGAEFDALAEDYFSATFGTDGPQVRAYLARLSQLFDPPYLRGDVIDGKAVQERLAPLATPVSGVSSPRGRGSERIVFPIIQERGDSHTWILEGGQPALSRRAADKLRQIPAAIDAFAPVIERNRGRGDACTAQSWAYLALHAEVARKLALAFLARAEGKQDEARVLWAQTADLVQQNEDKLQPVLDVFEFVTTLGRQFRGGGR